MAGNVLVVTKKRNDAIGIVDDSMNTCLANLYAEDSVKHDPINVIRFLELFPRENNMLHTFINYSFSCIMLLLGYLRYDVIHFTSPDNYGVLLNLLFPSKKSIITMHHLEGPWLSSTITKKILDSSSHIIATSMFSKEQLTDEWGIDPKKISVNYCGISKNFYPEKISNFQGYEYILYVGDEYPRKNIKNALLAFREFLKVYPDIKFVKIGKVRSKKNKDKTDSIIKSLGLQKDVIIRREFISEHELRRYYSNALLFLFPSLMEGFAQTPAEATACGCPVIVSDRKPMSELAEDPLIKVDPLDIKGIKDAMIKVTKDKDLRKNLSEKGLKISKRYTWERYSEKTASIYRRLLR
jgi:glycosyltransferase involved in cell wall biosynthesis